MPANALQAGVYARLVGYSPLTTALGGPFVYDNVPQGTAAPYVLIGDDTLNEDDTKTANGWNVTLTIHCWDFEKAGRKSVKTIMGCIYDALHRNEGNLTVSGLSVLEVACEFQRTIQETAEEGSNDHYYHGVMRFRALIKP